MLKIARFRPFLWLGLFTLLVMLVGRWVPLDYDDRGLGTAWFAFTYVLTYPFQKASQLAHWVTGSYEGAAQTALALILGGAFYVIADLVLSRYARRRQET